MVKIYKVLAISEVLGVSLFDFIKEEAIDAQINIHNDNIPGVCSTLQKLGEGEASAIIGVIKGKQLEPFVQGQDMFYVKNGDSVVEEATPITTIDDIVTSTELDNPKEIPGLNIHIITTE
jgi:hypothetical protein